MRCLALFICFLTKRAAFVGFVIHGLRDSSWPSHVADDEHLYLKIAAVICDSQLIADMDFPRRLGGVTVRLNSSQLARALCQRARLEESRRPQPLVYPYAVHNVLSHPPPAPVVPVNSVGRLCYNR